MSKVWFGMSNDSAHTYPGGEDALPIKHEDDLIVARAAAEEGPTIVLVEGLNDKAAIDALAGMAFDKMRSASAKRLD
jgi:hypothetical protein